MVVVFEIALFLLVGMTIVSLGFWGWFSAHAGMDACFSWASGRWEATNASTKHPVNDPSNVVRAQLCVGQKDPSHDACARARTVW